MRGSTLTHSPLYPRTCFFVSRRTKEEAPLPKGWEEVRYRSGKLSLLPSNF